MSNHETSALLNELINVEELEEKTAPSGQWDVIASALTKNDICA